MSKMETSLSSLEVPAARSTLCHTYFPSQFSEYIYGFQ